VINRDAPSKALVVKTVDQPKSQAERARERQQTKVEKGKTQEPAAAAETKTESQERKATKGPEVKSAGPAVVPETKETKQTKDGRQLGRGDTEKPAAIPEGRLRGERERALEGSPKLRKVAAPLVEAEPQARRRQRSARKGNRAPAMSSRGERASGLRGRKTLGRGKGGKGRF
jgi:hypothetical protein